MSEPGYERVHVTTWCEFDTTVRVEDRQLLARLDDFPNSVLVAGCQRSGTSILSEVIAESREMNNDWSGRGDELFGALLLSGELDHAAAGRYCFQTTYVDDAYREYYKAMSDGHKIVWLLRNPWSVVHSMLYNWKTLALNATFRRCGSELLAEPQHPCLTVEELDSVDGLQKACLIYRSKTLQCLELSEAGTDTLIVVDYDKLVEPPTNVVRQLYEYLDLDFDKRYTERLHTRAITKRRLLLPEQEREIERAVGSIYEDAAALGMA